MLKKSDAREAFVGGFCHEVKNRSSAVAAFMEVLLGPPGGLLRESSQRLGELKALVQQHVPHGPRATMFETLEALEQDNATLLDLSSTVAEIATLLNAHSRELYLFLQGTDDLQNAERLDIPELLRTCLQAHRALASQQHIEVRVEANEACFAKAVRSHLYIVLANLIVNSIEVLRDSAKPNKVLRATVHPEDKRVLVDIYDSGPGVAEDVAGRIFEHRFTTKSYGTGLGLYLARHFAELHGGSLTLDTVYSDGAHLRLELPLVA